MPNSEGDTRPAMGQFAQGYVNPSLRSVLTSPRVETALQFSALDWPLWFEPKETGLFFSTRNILQQVCSQVWVSWLLSREGGCEDEERRKCFYRHGQ